jgi:hypothetical protein
MEPIELPELMNVTVHTLVDWRPAQPVEPNQALLSQMNQKRSRQSARSRKSQSFITGMSAYRMSNEEMARKRAYIEEWHSRIGDNEYPD